MFVVDFLMRVGSYSLIFFQGKKHARGSDGEAEERPKPSRTDDSDDDRKKSRRKRSDDESDGDDSKKKKRHYKKKPISADHYDSASD